jgi:hypothetical protein
MGGNHCGICPEFAGEIWVLGRNNDAIYAAESNAEIDD